MCGRYASSANPDELVAAYDIQRVTDDGAAAATPHWNIAPTDLVPAVVERAGDDDAVRTLVGLRWGLVPRWSKDRSGAARLINARAETVASKPAFRAAFAQRRCILPALGYYEWRAADDGGRTAKQPYFLRPAEGGLLSMAGIYEFWKGPDGWLATAAIITTQATDEVGWVHDRMPMTVLDQAAWLDPTLNVAEAAQALLVPPPGLVPTKVSRAVGNVRVDSPALVEPLEAE